MPNNEKALRFAARNTLIDDTNVLSNIEKRLFIVQCWLVNVLLNLYPQIHAEAVVHNCSIGNLFWEFLESLQENTRGNKYIFSFINLFLPEICPSRLFFFEFPQIFQNSFIYSFETAYLRTRTNWSNQLRFIGNVSLNFKQPKHTEETFLIKCVSEETITN